MSKWRGAQTLVLLLSVAGCLKEGPMPVEADQSLPVTLEWSTGADTKSCIDFGSETVKDINVYAFSGGRLSFQTFFAQGSRSVQIRLVPLTDYNIYIIAGHGHIRNHWDDEQEFRRNISMQIEDMFDLHDSVPLAGEYHGYNTKTGRTVCIPLKRLVSRVDFLFHSSVPASAVKISSLSLRQSAMDVFPFMEGGSRPNSVGEGDFATEKDLLSLTNGGRVSFYCLENMQGILLPDNIDPWSKTPENLDESVAGMATYLEIGCRFSEGSFQSGDLNYRFYLGEDATTSFNIERNQVLTVSLDISPEGMDQSSWKVESSAGFTEGHASSLIAEGLHKDPSDLYIGETFTLEVQADDMLLEYYGNDLNTAGLALFDSEGNYTSAIEADGFTPKQGSGRWVARCTCLQPVENGSIYMTNSMGTRVQLLCSAVNIKKPTLRVCDRNDFLSGTLILSSSNTSLRINNPADKVLYIYFVDGNSRALGGEWFDNRLFSLSAEPSTGNAKYRPLTGQIAASCERNGAHDTCAGELHLALRHDGSSESVSTLLVESLKTNPFSVQTKESNYDLSATVAISEEYYPITLNYASNTQQLTLNNPSRLPLRLQYCDVSIFSSLAFLENITSAKDMETSFTFSGIRYGVTRHDAVSFYNQSFGCSEAGETVRHFPSQTQTIYLGDVLSSHLSYTDFNRQNYGSQAFCKTWTSVDVMLQGQAALYPTEALDTSTGVYAAGAPSSGEHDGLAVFSSGKLVCASAGLTPTSDNLAAINESEEFVVYSPAAVKRIWTTDVEVDMSSTVEDGSTSSITAKIGAEGENSVIRIDYEQAAAVKTYPGGTWRSAEYFWAAPAPYLSIQYLCTDPDLYTSSNLTVSSGLRSSYTHTLYKGLRMYEMVPIKKILDTKVFMMNRTDSYNAIGSANSFLHPFHPISCSILGTLSAKEQSGVYRSNMDNLLKDEEYCYKNLNYPSRDDEATTVWTFKNSVGGHPGSNAVSTGRCYLFRK